MICWRITFCPRTKEDYFYRTWFVSGIVPHKNAATCTALRRHARTDLAQYRILDDYGRTVGARKSMLSISRWTEINHGTDSCRGLHCSGQYSGNGKGVAWHLPRPLEFIIPLDIWQADRIHRRQFGRYLYGRFHLDICRICVPMKTIIHSYYASNLSRSGHFDVSV